MDGYNYNSGNCVQCLYPCLTCNANSSPNNCATCSTPYYFSDALPNGTCLLNLIPNCINVSSTNQSLCSACSTGYVLNSTSNKCAFSCPNYCKVCNNSTFCT
jgi:hypothetical protein